MAAQAYGREEWGTSRGLRAGRLPIFSRHDGRHRVIRILQELHLDLKKGKGSGWENDTLPSYLEALAGWLEDCEGYYANKGRPLPLDSWEIMADALRAARIYE